ncbi:MAG: hypothetical protein J6R04_02240 [Clostridia bacterium]|nr:hypothetical protein [Clostridia bacterium]
MTTIDRVPQTFATVRYRLLRVRVRGEELYLISVRLGSERCTAILPATSLAQARAFYRAIRDGLVTPCTLSDVVSELI